MSKLIQLLPRLRPIEAFPVQQDGEQMVLVQDPAGLADGPIVLATPGFFILTLMDGRHTLTQIQYVFKNQFGQELPRAQLEKMVEQLDQVCYLDSPRFADYYRSLVEAYKAGPTRLSGDPASLGADQAGLGPMLDRLLDGAKTHRESRPDRRLLGLIAPHLDYARGAPAYAQAYRIVASAGPAKRFVIVGTNHFGRAGSVVATSKPFQTPLGITRTDREFLANLEKRCGADLCKHELDHQREHSVELQVLILQHLFGAGNFEIVPLLCHDPCGPTGTAPYGGDGVDLRVFAEALGELIRSDGKPTVLIAGADLSHVGPRFGDEYDLDEPFLKAIEERDRGVLDLVVAGSRDGLVELLASRENDTRICSAGCIYALMTALPGSKGELLGYHQAADRESGTGVTCSAVAFWEE